MKSYDSASGNFTGLGSDKPKEYHQDNSGPVKSIKLETPGRKNGYVKPTDGPIISYEDKREFVDRAIEKYNLKKKYKGFRPNCYFTKTGQPYTIIWKKMEGKWVNRGPRYLNENWVHVFYAEIKRFEERISKVDKSYLNSL